MSDHSCPIVRVRLEPHPNADTLSIVRVGDFQCVVKTSDWEDGDLGVYCPPDSLVSGEVSEFSFLGPGKHRIKAKRLRGVVSMGLLVPCPRRLVEGYGPDGDYAFHVGDSAHGALMVEHWDPPEPLGRPQHQITGGDVAPPPQVGFPIPVMDVENLRRYPDIFEPGEEIIVTEKLHGTSARYVKVGDTIHVGSRKTWKKYDKDSVWWRALNRTPSLVEFLHANPGVVVYGEVFGAVQDMRYGLGSDVAFRAFDLLDYGYWLDWHEAQSYEILPWVPVIYAGPFISNIHLYDLAEDASRIIGAPHPMEGVVVKTAKSRYSRHVDGRAMAKIISNWYMTR